MDLFFLFKKLVGVFFTPLPIVFLLLSYGIYQLYKGRARQGLLCSLSGLCLLLFTSMPIVGGAVLRQYEFAYEKLDVQNLKQEPKYIVVLGCWHSKDELLPLVAQIHQCSLARIVQGVQFWNKFPNSKLIFSGFSGRGGKPSHPEVNAQLAMELGVPEKQIILSIGNKDTAEEARVLSKTLFDSSFILVTSASHIPRSVKLFKAQGLNPIPSPAEYLSGHGDFSWQVLVPRASAIEQTERAMYEFLGNTWISIKLFFQSD